MPPKSTIGRTLVLGLRAGLAAADALSPDLAAVGAMRLVPENGGVGILAMLPALSSNCEWRRGRAITSGTSSGKAILFIPTSF